MEIEPPSKPINSTTRRPHLSETCPQIEVVSICAKKNAEAAYEKKALIRVDTLDDGARRLQAY
jgi:hypothetical protein